MRQFLERLLCDHGSAHVHIPGKLDLRLRGHSFHVLTLTLFFVVLSLAMSVFAFVIF